MATEIVEKIVFSAEEIARQLQELENPYNRPIATDPVIVAAFEQEHQKN